MRWDEIKREEKERKERKKNGWWMEVHEKDFHSRDCFIWLSTRKEQFMDGSSVNAMKYCGEHSTEWVSENEGEEEDGGEEKKNSRKKNASSLGPKKPPPPPPPPSNAMLFDDD